MMINRPETFITGHKSLNIYLSVLSPLLNDYPVVIIYNPSSDHIRYANEKHNPTISKIHIFSCILQSNVNRVVCILFEQMRKRAKHDKSFLSGFLCMWWTFFAAISMHFFFSIWENPKDLYSMAKNSENSTSKADFRLDGKIDLVFKKEMQQAITPIPNKNPDLTTEVVHFQYRKKEKQLRIRMWTTTLFSRESDKNVAEKRGNPVCKASRVISLLLRCFVKILTDRPSPYILFANV